jgi:hypothetical protein
MCVEFVNLLTDEVKREIFAKGLRSAEDQFLKSFKKKKSEMKKSKINPTNFSIIFFNLLSLTIYGNFLRNSQKLTHHANLFRATL